MKHLRKGHLVSSAAIVCMEQWAGAFNCSWSSVLFVVKELIKLCWSTENESSSSFSGRVSFQMDPSPDPVTAWLLTSWCLRWRGSSSRARGWRGQVSLLGWIHPGLKQCLWAGCSVTLLHLLLLHSVEQKPPVLVISSAK